MHSYAPFRRKVLAAELQSWKSKKEAQDRRSKILRRLNRYITSTLAICFVASFFSFTFVQTSAKRDMQIFVVATGWPNIAARRFTRAQEGACLFVRSVGK
jgi:hypothetical protein